MNHLFFLDLWASDKGTYICEAENQFGKIQSQTTVTVTGLGKLNEVLSTLFANIRLLLLPHLFLVPFEKKKKKGKYLIATLAILPFYPILYFLDVKSGK